MKDEKKLVFFDTSRWKVFFISNIILRIMEFSVRWSFIVIVLESSFIKYMLNIFDQIVRAKHIRSYDSYFLFFYHINFH